MNYYIGNINTLIHHFFSLFWIDGWIIVYQMQASVSLAANTTPCMSSTPISSQTMLPSTPETPIPKAHEYSSTLNTPPNEQEKGEYMWTMGDENGIWNEWALLQASNESVHDYE